LQHETQQFRRAFEEEDKPALPYRPEHNQYPCIVHHPAKGKKLVKSADEHASLGDGWNHVGHEKPAEPKAADAGSGELSQEADERITELEDRVTQLEAMVADLISKKKPAKDKPADSQS